MRTKSQKQEPRQKPKNGWKLYPTPEEVVYLEEQARKLGYRSAQAYLQDKIRQERLKAQRAK